MANDHDNFEVTEVDPRVESIADTLLELIGEVVKVTILISELPDESVPYVLPRFNALVSAVNSLEIEEYDSRNFSQNVGEA